MFVRYFLLYPCEIPDNFFLLPIPSQCEPNAVDYVGFALLDADLKVPCKKSGPDHLHFSLISFVV